MGFNYTIDNIKPYIIFSAISGSHAYGTNTPESDKDIRGIFVQPLDHILKYGFIDQVSDEKNDIIFYELGRFIHLLIANNPNIMELLNLPEDCIILEKPEFQYLKGFRDKFLTKKVRWTFAGYAIDQIQKARGYNKKMNWEAAEMKRKTVLDFCYVVKDAGSQPVKEWIIGDIPKKTWVSQKNFGLSAIDHSHNLYAMFYNKEPLWGIVSDEETANDVQLISIPKNVPISGYLTFNKDAYSTHCKMYKEYQTWLKERNPNRVKMNKEHGKNYDSKNMAHCVRLLDMVAEMLDTGEIIVRRPPEHVKLLMSIKRGEKEYEDLLRMAEDKISTLDEKCMLSKLPKEVDKEFANKLLLEIRKIYYNL